MKITKIFDHENLELYGINISSLLTSAAKNIDVNLFANVDDECVHLWQQANREDDRKE